MTYNSRARAAARGNLTKISRNGTTRKESRIFYKRNYKITTKITRLIKGIYNSHNYSSSECISARWINAIRKLRGFISLRADVSCRATWTFKWKRFPAYEHCLHLALWIACDSISGNLRFRSYRHISKWTWRRWIYFEEARIGKSENSISTKYRCIDECHVKSLQLDPCWISMHNIAFQKGESRSWISRGVNN